MSQATRIATHSTRSFIFPPSPVSRLIFTDTDDISVLELQRQLIDMRERHKREVQGLRIDIECLTSANDALKQIKAELECQIQELQMTTGMSACSIVPKDCALL
jgi:replicative DNA helicase